MDKKNEDTKVDEEGVKEEDQKKEKKEANDEHLQNEVKNWEDKYKRALADYQNLQRHTQEQRIIWASQASKDIILKLLPVLDTLMLTAKHFPDKSLQLAVDQFLTILKDEGVQKIETVGREFDPNLMEAITKVKGEDNKPDVVVEEVRVGYKLNDQILRHAQVVVAVRPGKVSNTPAPEN